MALLGNLLLEISTNTGSTASTLKQVREDFAKTGTSANASTQKARTAFGRLGDSLKSTAGRVPVLGGALSSLVSPVGLATAAVGALVGGLTTSITKITSLETELRPFIARSNLSAESLQAFAKVAERLGSEDGLEGVTDSVQELQLRLAEAVQDGTGPAVAAFEKLGLSSKDLIDASPEESFLATITAIQGLNNEADKKFLADELLGGASEKLSGIINAESGEFQALTASIRETGDIVSNEAVASAREFNNALGRLGAGVGRVRTQIGTALIPALTSVINVVSGHNQARDQLSDLDQTLFDLRETTGLTSQALDEHLARSIERVGDAAENAARDIKTLSLAELDQEIALIQRQLGPAGPNLTAADRERGEVLLAEAQAQRELTAAGFEYSKLASRLEGDIRQVSDAERDNILIGPPLVQAKEAIGVAIGRLAENATTLNEEEKLNLFFTNLLGKSYDDLGGNVDDIISAFRDYNGVITDSTTSTDTAAASQAGLRGELRPTTEALKKQAAELKKQVEAAQNLADTIASVTGARADEERQSALLALATTDVGKARLAEGLALVDLEKAQLAYDVALIEANRGTGKAAELAKALEQADRQLTAAQRAAEQASSSLAAAEEARAEKTKRAAEEAGKAAAALREYEVALRDANRAAFDASLAQAGISDVQYRLAQSQFKRLTDDARAALEELSQLEGLDPVLLLAQQNQARRLQADYFRDQLTALEGFNADYLDTENARIQSLLSARDRFVASALAAQETGDQEAFDAATAAALALGDRILEIQGQTDSALVTKARTLRDDLSNVDAGGNTELLAGLETHLAAIDIAHTAGDTVRYPAALARLRTYLDDNAALFDERLAALEDFGSDSLDLEDDITTQLLAIREEYLEDLKTAEGEEHERILTLIENTNAGILRRQEELNRERVRLAERAQAKLEDSETAFGQRLHTQLTQALNNLVVAQATGDVERIQVAQAALDLLVANNKIALDKILQDTKDNQRAIVRTRYGNFNRAALLADANAPIGSQTLFSNLPGQVPEGGQTIFSNSGEVARQILAGAGGMAEGGIAMGPTFAALAERGRPELVAPLDQLPRLMAGMRGGGGGDTYITVPVQGSILAEDLTELIRRSLDDAQRRGWAN